MSEEEGPRSVSVWVTLGWDTKVAISFLKPVMHIIKVSDRIGLYPEPGEMIWIPGQCVEIAELLVGQPLQIGVPLRATLSIKPIQRVVASVKTE